MIAIDTSAIVTVLLRESEADIFLPLIFSEHVIVGTPTLVETRMVLEEKLLGRAREALERFLAESLIDILPFDKSMFEAAADAFLRYGKDRGHPAKLNFGDCLSYAVAKAHALPLLFKGSDFVHTDLVPAYRPVP